MLTQQFLNQVNHIAIIVSTVVYFMAGALWYSPVLFGNSWLKLQGKTKEDFKQGPNRSIFLFTFICLLVACYAIGFVMFMFGAGNLIDVIKVGLLLSLGFSVTTQIINSLYNQRSFKLMLIDAGYHVVGIVVATIIIAYWR